MPYIGVKIIVLENIDKNISKSKIKKNVRPNKNNVVFPVSRPGWKKTCRLNFLWTFYKDFSEKIKKIGPLQPKLWTFS